MFRAGLSLMAVVLLVAAGFPFRLGAQIDPEPRRLIQGGYNQPVEGRGPIAGYAFYYHNQPNFQLTNLTLRLAIAPVFLDSEIGFSEALGPNTDAAIGVAGGGFAYSYSEVRGGHYYREESFTGHGGDFSGSIYHRFNPEQRIPVWLVVRGIAQRAFYQSDSTTAPEFEIPEDRTTGRIRTGLRFGGQEPMLTAPLAMELSLWHESMIRSETGPYGYDDDRDVRSSSHQFWGRALLKLTTESEQLFETSVVLGTTVNADRFSAFRLGGVLPFAAEFPLNLPGYYYQELSADDFVLFNAQYSFPITPARNWRLAAYAATAGVDYLDGLEQPGHWHSGVGGGLSYISPSGAWMITALYAHGLNAIRNDGRGANQVGVILQYDFDARSRGRSRFFMPGVSPYRSRGGEQLYRR